MDERERYEQGMAVRRAVLGAAHVDRAAARADAFDAEFQDLLTRYDERSARPRNRRQ